MYKKLLSIFLAVSVTQGLQAMKAAEATQALQKLAQDAEMKPSKRISEFKKLLNQGADVDAQTADKKYSILHLAALSLTDDIKFYQELLKKANPLITDYKNRTPLQLIQSFSLPQLHAYYDNYFFAPVSRTNAANEAGLKKYDKKIENFNKIADLLKEAEKNEANKKSITGK